eukprot:CAMPEP_0170176514 /NCGR_PEP_ID=MMETSP0040_2-20121228/9377_1 /TAXON_ID=641309 /ORGANISM="Lotharella oceanica, Strain CCMP622" /LENGTH=202 /DNA_ID=CAMNT_0010418863 /DNA_START=33 /DNA_END=641 /DNA_ORIENTATION=+
MAVEHKGSNTPAENEAVTADTTEQKEASERKIQKEEDEHTCRIPREDKRKEIGEKFFLRRFKSVSCSNVFACYRYFFSPDKHMIHKQPVYLKADPTLPVAHFKSVDRITGPCCCFERLSRSIEPTDDLTDEDYELLGYYLFLTSGQSPNWESGHNLNKIQQAWKARGDEEEIDKSINVHERNHPETTEKGTGSSRYQEENMC